MFWLRNKKKNLLHSLLKSWFIKVDFVISGSRQVTAATAFLLALFSHILNHVVIRLQGALYEKENPNKLLQSNTHPYGRYNITSLSHHHGYTG